MVISLDKGVRSSVRTWVRPHFSKTRKQNKFQMKIMIATAGTLGLTEVIFKVYMHAYVRTVKI